MLRISCNMQGLCPYEKLAIWRKFSYPKVLQEGLFPTMIFEII